MFKTILIENIKNFLRKHPLLWSSMLFVVISFLIRYLIIDIGIYLWFSYFALGISLLAGSLYFGISWLKVTREKTNTQLYKIATLALLLPASIALADVILRYAIARITGQASITVIGISNKLQWLTLPNGYSYFYTERFMLSDSLWLYSILGILLSFLVGVFISRQKTQKA